MPKTGIKPGFYPCQRNDIGVQTIGDWSDSKNLDSIKLRELLESARTVQAECRELDNGQQCGKTCAVRELMRIAGLQLRERR